MQTQSEDQLQAQCYQWFHNTYPQHRGKLWHVPNGGSRDIREAQKFKAMGMLKGVHDLHLYINKQLYTFELKVGSNKLSQEQVKWKATMTSEGAICYEIRDFETFEQAIRSICDNIV